MAGTLSAERTVKRLESYRSPAELEKLQRHFKPPGGTFRVAEMLLADDHDLIHKAMEARSRGWQAGSPKALELPG